MTESIRVGIVGSGGMAGSRATTFSSLDGCELVALAARNSETGAELAGKYNLTLSADWQGLVGRDDVDAVVVCTNNHSHADMACAALEAGKHVFLEYPLARHLGDGERLVQLAQDSDRVLRVAHNESYSSRHRGLKRAVSSMGPLLTALFVRLTPGRGARPQMLFNLEVSGPPALFFIYQIYPLVDLFGPAEWVEGYAHYIGLGDDGRYERFVNTVTVGFTGGGQAHWTWAGGVPIAKAEQYQRLVLGEGTLMNEARTGWMRSTSDDVEAVEADEQASASMEEMFLQEILGEQELWREDLERSLDASRISAGAETAAAEGRRVVI